MRHLDHLEAESILLLREVLACARAPVILYSVGKDSSVLLHLALKAAWPARLAAPLLHVESGWDFADLLAHRDRVAAEHDLELRVARAPEPVCPWGTPNPDYVRAALTQPLVAALEAGGYDAVIGGGRRDEERARAKERMVSVRHGRAWNPHAQRPEFWSLHNLRVPSGAHTRVFPLSNWTEADIWAYAEAERIPLVPLYFAANRPCVRRAGQWLVVDDPARMRWEPGERPEPRRVRFRTLGCWPLSAAAESDAADVPAIRAELAGSRLSERAGRLIDGEGAGTMEAKKAEGYF